jgi:hypothetical protein
MYGSYLAKKLFTVSLLGGWIATSVAAQSSRPELAIKTEFVLRFPEFVEWPAPADGRSLSLCLSAAHPFGHAFQESLNAQSRGRRITVRELRNGETARGCDALYVAPSDLSLLSEVRDLPILTIGDQPNFCQRGGIINLLVVDGRVRFEIDLERARHAKLKLDSQLLRLASKVHGRWPPSQSEGWWQ